MRVELEITLRCNRACPTCNIHCNLFDFIPLDDLDTDMTLEQVDRFCWEVINKGKRLRQVSIIGGEPLLHPEFATIVDMLYKLLYKQKLVGELRLCTNGDFLSTVHPSVLEKTRIKVDWTKEDYRNMLAAPCDTGQSRRECHIPHHCGIGLNTFGYWPCGAGGAIARLFGKTEFQRLVLPDCVSEFGDLSPLCNLCQLAARNRIMVLDEGTKPSSSFVTAIEAYKADPVYPRLKRYGDED